MGPGGGAPGGKAAALLKSGRCLVYNRDRRGFVSHAQEVTPMREVEVVEHPQIDGLHLFFDTVQYRTPHIHRELEVIWLAEGALDVRIEQTQLRVQPGELVLFHPGQLHEFRAVGAGCTFLCAQIAPELAERPYPAFARLRFDAPCPGRVLPAARYEALVDILLAMMESYLTRPEGYELSCTGRALLLLGRLVAGVPHQVLSGGEMAGQQRRNDRALRLIRFVDENYTHKINLSDFAQAEGISLGYASHFAREALGQSFQDYVDTVRFHAACQRIAAGKERLVEVYAASGFSDYRYFSRAFQKRFGLTPEEYRRAQRPVSGETRIHHSVHSLERFYSREKSLALLAEICIGRPGTENCTKAEPESWQNAEKQKNSKFV